MKTILIIFSIIISFSIFSEDINSMIDSSDIIKQKLGIRKAAAEKKFENRIISLLDNSNLEIKMEAARALGKYGTDTALDALLKTVKSTTSEDLQASIIQALINYSTKDKAVSAIMDLLLEGKTEFTRSIAAQQLSKINTEKVVDTLIEALEDDSPLVRGKAANSLGKLKNKKAVPALKKLKKDDPDNGVKSYAASALQKMGVVKTKSTTTALLFGLTPINGLGLWYSGHKILAITDFILEGASIGMILYGWDSINETNANNELKEPTKHYTAMAGFAIFVVSYLLDVIYPIYSVTSYNESQKSDSITFRPSFFTDGETTVFGFSFNF